MLTVAICVWPKCEAATNQQVNVPLCDHHAAVAYRRIAEALKDTKPAPLATLTLPKGTGHAGRNQKDQWGLIYFARCGELVKIGFTTNLRQRMSNIRADEVLATLPGTRRTERALHHRFGHAWEHGEYFRPCQEISEFIDTLPSTGQTTRV